MQFMFNLSNMAALSLGVQSSLPSAACGIELPLMCACCSFVSSSCHDGPFVVHLLCDRALCVCVCVVFCEYFLCEYAYIYSVLGTHRRETGLIFPAAQNYPKHVRKCLLCCCSYFLPLFFAILQLYTPQAPATSTHSGTWHFLNGEPSRTTPRARAAATNFAQIFMRL